MTGGSGAAGHPVELIEGLIAGGASDQRSQALWQVIDEARASGNDPLALAAVIQRPAQLITPEDLARVRADVLIVTDPEDVTAGTVDALAKALPARTVVVDALDHVSTPRTLVFQQHAAAFIDYQS